MSKDFLEELCASFEDVGGSLAGVEKRKMFGCNAFFKGDAIFGLIWKTGRIGLKFDNEVKFGELMALKGSAPWKAGNKVMSKWVLVPEDFHDDKRELSKWVRSAHSLTEAKAAKAAKKKAKKAPAKKKALQKSKRSR